MAEFDDSLPAQLAAAREMVFSGQFEEAWMLLNRLDAFFPDSPDIIALMGDATLRAGDAEHAWELYDQAIDLDPTWSGVWSARARCSIDMCNLAAARSDIQHALFLDPKNAEAHYTRAILAEFEGDGLEAEIGYLQALKLDPENFQRPFRVRSDADFAAVMWEVFEEISMECPLPVEIVLVVEDLPAVSEFAETGLSPLSPGYLDLPLTVDGVFADIEPPARIVLYRLNIERLARDADELRHEIELTLVNEIMNLYDECEEPVPECLERRGGDFID